MRSAKLSYAPAHTESTTAPGASQRSPTAGAGSEAPTACLKPSEEKPARCRPGPASTANWDST